MRLVMIQRSITHVSNAWRWYISAVRTPMPPAETTDEHISVWSW
jgi:hypothetical protein